MNLQESDGPNYERDEPSTPLKSRKATHKGTCQACGSVQRLPNGRLANHGYTVKWNMFGGICLGSKELPFEKSYDLISKFITNAKDQIIEQLHEVEVLENYSGNLGWHRAYFNGEYSWRQIEITQENVDSNTFKDQNNKNCYFSTYSYSGKFVNEVIKNMNKTRVEYHKQKIKKLKEYIEWQRGRVFNWKEADLIEIK